VGDLRAEQLRTALGRLVRGQWIDWKARGPREPLLNHCDQPVVVEATSSAVFTTVGLRTVENGIASLSRRY
jgi:hypothetical protein